MLCSTTYWVGMAGTLGDLSQTGLLGVAGGDSRMAQFSGSSFSFMTGTHVGDMAFRLYGVPGAAPVPEPRSLTLLARKKRIRVTQQA
jgi:hypothetical protein